MGMFDKDRMYGGERLDQTFELGEEFIVYDVRIESREVPTELGMATKTVLTVARTSDPDTHFDVGTLASAIADKAEEAEPSDFPTVCKTEKVPSSQPNANEAFVLSFVRPYVGEGATAPAAGEDD